LSNIILFICISQSLQVGNLLNLSVTVLYNHKDSQSTQ